LPIVGLEGRTISSSANPIFSSGGTNNAEHLILTSSKCFQSAVVPGGRNSNPPPSAIPARCMQCTMRALLLFSIIAHLFSCTTPLNRNIDDFKMLTTDTTDLEFAKYRGGMLNLQQIQTGVDSFEFRIWNFGVPNELVILRLLNSKWITCHYSYQINAKNIVDSQTVLCRQINPQMALNIVNYLTQDSILKMPSQYSIKNFKDTSIYEGGCTYSLEIATKDFYKTLLYNNPHVHADAYNKSFVRLIKFLETNLRLLHRFE